MMGALSVDRGRRGVYGMILYFHVCQRSSEGLSGILYKESTVTYRHTSKTELYR